MANVSDQRVYENVSRICLVGGGDLMAFAAREIVGLGLHVTAIVAPRHAGEGLPILGGTLEENLADADVVIRETENINDLSTWSVDEIAGPNALAICFGPSWIFSDAVRNAFGHGMVNVNPIPVPRYLGGAHFTWQILNGDRNGGCFVQEITADLDRGAILQEYRFMVPTGARTPTDYFQAYFDESSSSLRRFIDHVVKGEAMTRVPYDSVNADRLYFPRLMTIEQAYIDWSWTAEDIEKFCNAFDDPYAGAMTFVDDTLVHVKNVSRMDGDHDFHPFCAGLVVRRLGDEIIVAANDGALRIGGVLDEEGNDARKHLKEGRRLVTPGECLDHARAYRPKLSAKGFEKGGGTEA